MRLRCRQTFRSPINVAQTQKLCVGLVLATFLSACGVTARIEPYKQTNSVINEAQARSRDRPARSAAPPA